MGPEIVWLVKSKDWIRGHDTMASRSVLLANRHEPPSCQIVVALHVWVRLGSGLGKHMAVVVGSPHNIK